MPPPSSQLSRIGLATVAMADELLALQQLCFHEEAEAHQEFNIPPLTQTLESLQRDFLTHTTLAAWQGQWLVGAVRGRRDGRIGRIGRLMVHPDYRNRGLGARLMKAIEAAFPGVDAFELFTGHLSVRNLQIYAHLGYAPYRREVVTPRLTLVHLRKRIQLPAEFRQPD